MTTTTYLTTLKDREVDIYCGGTDEFSGKVKACDESTVTLRAPDGTIKIATEDILSVTPH